MGIIKRHGIASSIFIYLGIIIGFVNVILLYPYIVGEEVLGFTRAFDEYATLFLLLGGFGTSLATVRFFPHFRNKEQQHSGFLSFLFWVRTIGLLVTIVLVFLLKDIVLAQIEQDLTRQYVADYYFLIPLMLALSTYTEMLEYYAVGLMRPRIPVFFREVIIRLATTVFLALFYFGWIDEQQFIYLFAGRFILALGGLLIFTIAIGELHFKSGKHIFKAPVFKEMTKYSFYALFSTLGSKISGKVDILMLTAMVHLEAVAIYVVMAYIARVIQVPHEGIAKIASPIVSEAWKQNDLTTIQKLYKRMALNNFAAGLLIYIGIIANFDNLFSILKPEYIEGKVVIIFLGLSQLVSVLNGYNGLVIIHSPKFRFDLYSKIITAIIAIASNYFLIKTMGLTGAAIATAVTLILANLIIQWFVYRHFKMLPFSWNMVKIMAIGLLTFALHTLIPAVTNFWLTDLIVRSSILSLFYLGMLILFNAAPDISEYVKTKFRK